MQSSKIVINQTYLISDETKRRGNCELVVELQTSASKLIVFVQNVHHQRRPFIKFGNVESSSKFQA